MGRKAKFKFTPKQNGLVESSYGRYGVIIPKGDKYVVRKKETKINIQQYSRIEERSQST